MPKKKKPSPRRKATPPPAADRQLKVLLATLFLLAFLIGSLVLLATLRRTYGPRATTPTATRRLPLRQALQVEIESFLLRSGVPPDRLHLSGQGGQGRLEVAAALPTAPLLAHLAERLQRIAPGVRLEIRPASGEVLLHRGGVIPFVLHFVPPSPAPRRPRGPRLAIIVDDLGQNMESARDLVAIDLPVTFSVMPNVPFASDVATLGHRSGHEVIVHIPMQPLAYPRINPGKNALLVGLSAAQIRRRLLWDLQRVPYAVGGNNHMGSRFTEDRAGMDVVLEEMKKEGLFFIDSRTTAHSVALAEAHRLGVPTAARDVFLDNVQEVGPIDAQIRKLVRLARLRGEAIGICHPHPATLRALRREKDYFAKEGVTIVPVSQLLDGRKGG